MRKITCLFVLLLLVIQNSFSQNIYKRVTINNINDSVIQSLDNAGIDMTCGAIFTEDKLQIELSQNDLNQLSNQGISYTVLIDDLEEFYSERAISDLPKARLELELEKQMALQNARYSVSEVLNNVGQYDGCDEIDWATPANWNLNPNSSPNSFGGCLTYQMVLDELDDMRAQYPNLISAKADASPSNQTTLEGRTIYYVRISDNPDLDEAGEPETLYQSLIHSRESATVMNQLFFMWYLLENYDTDPAIRNLVNNQALYFIPVFNPDGFVYNQTVAPNGGGLQRKNRNTSAPGSCGTYVEGIDLNRNSAYYWGNGGSSTDSCSETYMGTGPFSENETQIMRDFFLLHDFELALNHHSFKNAMLHAYAGTNITNPRPDEYSKYNHDMTYYNRYAHGPSTSISSLNSGNMNDWMLGGPAGTSANGTPSGTGSGKETLAWTPENGTGSEAGSTGSGFWPAPSNFLPIAKRAMRMNFLAAYFSGKYGKIHDLNQSDITATSGNLEFAIENLGQKASDFTVTVTAVSSNITIPGATNSVTESFTAAQVLDQRFVSIPYTLNGGIQADDEVEFKVVFTNDYASDNVLYEANIKKTYAPTNVIFDDATDNLSNWTAVGTGGTWSATTDNYPNSAGNSAIKSNSAATYSNSLANGIQLNPTIDLTGVSTALVQFYAKWDLERSFDYVQLEASLDGSTWTPLCGKLTKPGAPDENNTYSGKSNTNNDFQPDGEPLYDGDTQDRWYMEEIVIDASNNSTFSQQSAVNFRFVFFTDSSNRQDSYYNADFEGFTFDDFKITEIKIPCVTSVPTNVVVSNVTTSTADVTWDVVPSATYDLRYRETGTTPWTDVLDLTMNTYAISGLTNFTEYEVQVRTKCTASTSAYTSSEVFTTLEACLDGTISSFPYTQGFENNASFINEWKQGVNNTDDDIDWTRDSGGTPSNNTGPTTGSGSTWYVYTEASTNVTPAGSPLKTAIITSDCIDFTDWENAKISFDYHMFGADLGSSTENPAEIGYVALEVSEDDGLNWTTETIINDDSANTWKTAVDIDLSSYDGKVVLIRFRGVTGSSWSSDMALDNINIEADPATGSNPPIALCQNITVQLDAAGNATIVAADVDGGSTDDVLITDLSIDIDTFDCNDIGTPVDVTLTVTDGDNQTDTCIATVTVEDQVDPEFVNVPANITLTCGNNQPTWTDPTVTDNCGTGLTPVRTDGTGLNSGSTFPNGLTTISYSVDDGNGNTNTASFTVNVVVDNQNPVAVCQNITVQLDASGNATITAAQINNGSTDNCGIASIAASQTGFTCADEGDNNVTLTVTDTNGNVDTCTAVVTITLQDAPSGLECWETANYNYTTCMWDVSGTQPVEPTATNCWDDYQFDTNDTSPTYCTWVNQGTEPIEPAATNCWDDYQFDTDDTSPTYCTWVNQGTEPIEPVATNCWDDYQLDNDDTSPTYCTWVNQGTEPIEPVATNCWDDYQFDNDDTSPTYCTWVNQGTEPVEPIATNCWDDYQFDTDDTSPTYCTWVNQGTEPIEPVATNCWDDYQLDNDDTSPTYCTWVNQGTEPIEPTATNCWDDYQFDNDDTSPTYCTWVNEGTEPIEPTATNCWDDYQFNNMICEWENLGTPPTEPTGLAVNSITATGATINWDALPPFDFDLRYREYGNPIWNDILDISTNTQNLTALLPLTEYIVEIRSKCSSSETSEYAAAITFTTLDDVTGYCVSESSNVDFEYISRVQLNTIDNTSGAQFYSDFTGISTILRKSQTYTITITPTFIGGPYNEGYAVWIDYNRDGDFLDSGEQVFTAGPNSNASVSGSFTVPDTGNILEEVTRMRVSFKYNDVPDACEEFQYGEVEDYSIRLAGSDDLIFTNNSWTPYAPSPTTVIENALVLDGVYNVTDDVQINNIKVFDGAEIIVEKSKSLTVNGDLISSDDVSLESDSDEYSSLIVTNSVFGIVEYKRHVNSTASTGGNDLIAPPVYGESFIDFRAANPNILSNGANTLFLFGPFDKVTDTYVLYTNTETAPLEAGIGYRAASTDASTFTFKGAVKTNNVKSTVVISGPTNPEWNLIGNPYPSYINLSDFLSANNSKFDAQRSGIYGYDGDASDGWTIWNQAYSDANPNAKITPGQGFLIASAFNQDDIEFSPIMRTIGSDDDFILGRQDNSSAISHLKLQMSGTSKLYFTDFYFTDNASLGLDYNYDSGLFGTAPGFSIYSHLVEENQGRNYGIQSIGTTNLSDVAIPLGVHVSEGQQVAISIAERTLSQDVDVYLEDNLTNTFTLLNTSDYTFTANTNISGTGRFYLRFAESTLSTSSTESSTIEVYTTTQPKTLFVKGNLLKDTQLTIHDIQGRLIKTWSLSKDQNTHRIDVSSMSTGVYVVTLKNGLQERTEKVVIK